MEIQSHFRPDGERRMHLPAGRREPGLRGKVQGADDQRLGLAPRAQQQGARAQAWRLRGGYQVSTFRMLHTTEVSIEILCIPVS